jgi:malic enzyme
LSQCRALLSPNQNVRFAGGAFKPKTINSMWKVMIVAAMASPVLIAQTPVAAGEGTVGAALLVATPSFEPM